MDKSLRKPTRRSLTFDSGGPGCSSLEAATQENGAFNLAPGTTNPVVNPNGWSTVRTSECIPQSIADNP